jgi:hypothetical protein
LIATYSNTSANGFTFWEYNVQDPSTGKNYFSDEEKETYEEIIEEWLNDKQTLSINNENKYSTRAYLGNYTATVKLGSQTVTKSFDVTSGKNEVVIQISNKVEKAELTTKPTKTSYIQNSEPLDLTGGVITVTYSDGSTKKVSLPNSNVKVSNFDNSKVGTTTVTLEYEGITTTFDVQVVAKQISSVKITTNPTKTSYIQNSETLDLTGGILMVTYNDGSVDEISLTNENINATGFDNSKLGINTISLEYNGYNTTFDVEIIEKEISKIEIATLPTKKKYIQNSETLDLTGGILTVTYDDKSTDEINMTNKNINASGFDNSKLGINTISLEYNGYNTTFDVEIIEKEISKIEIATLPTKEKYIQNSEPLDLTGGILMVTYNDGSVDEISLTNENINATGFDNSKQGTNIITIEYNGNTITFEVEILSNTEEIVDVPDTGIHKTIIMLIGISTIIVGTILFITSKKYAKKN